MLIVDLPLTPRGAVLIRVETTEPNWVRGLPRVPGPSALTVTVSDQHLTEVPADDLISRGYRIAGVAADAAGAGAVDILVPGALVEAHPSWFRGLLDLASRAFDLELGPVRSVLGEEIRLHVRALGRGGVIDLEDPLQEA